MSPNHHQSLPVAHTQGGVAQALLWKDWLWILLCFYSPALLWGCVWRPSPQGRCRDTWYCTDHWAVSSFLHPWKDIFPCVIAQSSNHSTGVTHPCWKDRWGTVKPHCRSQREECERRIILLSLPSELWTLILLLPFLLCLFLTRRNEQTHMNSPLGVDFEQPLGQEAPTSRLTDCMMACLQFGPEYIGEFQWLTWLQVPYFRSFHDLCLQSALQVPWTPIEYCQGAPYSCAFMRISCQGL